MRTIRPFLSSRARALSALGLAVVLFLAINLIATLGLQDFRADLTEQSLYTLSEGSRAIVRDIPEPVTIRLFRTQELIDAVPLLQNYAPQVMQTLRIFERLADGRIRFEIVEAAPFSAEEDQAIGFGLAGFDLSRSGERGYFGLVGTNSLDALETIPFLDPARQAFLQYDLTRLVYRLSQPSEPRVAIMDGMGMFGSMAARRPPWAVLNILGEDFELTQLATDADAVPPDTDVLVVAHPSNLTPQAQFAIDQYVLGGGAALVFVDPLAENSPPSVENPMRPQNPSSDLHSLLAAWGVKVDPAKVVGDRNMAMETMGTAGSQRVVADYLPWLRVDGPSLNRELPITARLEAMRLSSAGSIDPLPGATTSITPLIQSTDQSMLLDRDAVMARPNPNKFLSQFRPSGHRYTLAARITGSTRTAFPEGRPAGDGMPVPNAAAPLIQSKKPINVILVADADLLADSHVVGQDGRVITSNADFVLNAIGDLAGGDALIGVRGGRIVDRSFTTVEAMRDRAEAAYRATEQRLSEEMAEVQQRLAQLQGMVETGGSDALAIAQERQAGIAKANQRLADVRQQLREVRRALRADVDALDRWLKFLNIALIPILLVAAMALMGFWRKLRLRRYLRRQGAATEAS